VGATSLALAALSVAVRRAQGDGWAYQPTRSQTPQHGARGRETGGLSCNGGGPFQGPDSDRRRPRVDLVRRLPS
jgi:hypothetical protein